ncbi:DUF2971 domain-containing protein [Photobacterium leiognathi]|uniref:DUF2971 domain-containing protein n=1 Tax=Photobacterium leiognathi TaxID=553611 RepID=UPI0029810735|nr:DUF2971 domain-containing protein [Photobacterium leiognathi]
MILYKYVSYRTALQIIESSSIGFSSIDDLNDPFECTYFNFYDEDNEKIKSLHGYKNRFSRNYVLLSLTRNPLNSLMWSHYGDSHQGIVIGIDCEAAGFMDAETSRIPAHLGEVIYTSNKPKPEKKSALVSELLSIGNDIEFKNDTYNLLKRAFLYKSMEWGYEEEVRVVKDLKYHLGSSHDEDFEFENNSGTWIRKNIPSLGRPIFCFKLPHDCIKEVYFGRHVFRNTSRTKSVSDEQSKQLKDLCLVKNIKMYQCGVDPYSWNLLATQKDW